MTEVPPACGVPPWTRQQARAALACLVCAWLFIAFDGALAAGVPAIAVLDHQHGGGAIDLADLWFYLILGFFTALLGAIGLGFFWTRTGVRRGLPARVILGRYLAVGVLGLFALEAGGLVLGAIMDPPHGGDVPFAVLGATIDGSFLVVLSYTTWQLDRLQRQWRRGVSAEQTV